MLNYLPFVLLAIFCLISLYFAGRLDKSAEYRKKRRPFSDEMRLVRRPGEGLYKQIEEIDEQLSLKLFLILYSGMAAVMVVGVFSSLLRVSILGQSIICVLVAIAYTIFMVVSFRKMVGLVESRRKKYLGYFGECAVAEYLDGLKQNGYYVFHDVPGQDGESKFNIDHVVVGPTGLFAIETKTRSKYWSPEEKRREMIKFDGKKINFSWGPETKPIKQAAGRARWLATQFDFKYYAQPILTFPGWEVVEQEIGRVWILYPGGLAAAISRRSQLRLNAQEIMEICKHLESLCRDVEY
jgi:hypothetical protein